MSTSENILLVRAKPMSTSENILLVWNENRSTFRNWHQDSNETYWKYFTTNIVSIPQAGSCTMDKGGRSNEGHLVIMVPQDPQDY